ncbi:MAG: hypothetical protein AB7O59_14870 [Pirellulales bacterium]
MRPWSLLVLDAPRADGAFEGGSALFDAAESVAVDRVADLPAAAARLEQRANSYDLVVLCQRYPGSISELEIDDLRRRAPLTRFWRMLGSWCEGEQRTGRPPAGCLGTYWHQASRLGRELAAARQGWVPIWAQPVTATAEERALAALNVRRPDRGNRITVCAEHAQAAAALAEACAAGGYLPQIAPQQAALLAPAAIVWDTTAEKAADPACVAKLRHHAGNAPLIALVGFPRPGDMAAAARAGVATVVSKPFFIQDLWWQLERVAAGHAVPMAETA